MTTLKYTSNIFLYSTLIVVCGVWSTIYSVNLDDDLEIDVPEPDLKTTSYPITGKDFDITIKILKEFNEKLWDRSSEAWNNLRKKLQMAVLGIYVDNDYYQGLHVLEFSNGSINARLFIRFTQERKNHLEPLSQVLLNGQLGDLPVHNFFLNATKADYRVMQSILCGMECSTAETCTNDECANDCCELVSLLPSAALSLPSNTIKSGLFNTIPILSPINVVPYTQPTIQQFNTPIYRPQDHLLGNSMSSLCGPTCSSFCYPLCSPTCCNSLQRSFIPNQYIGQY